MDAAGNAGRGGPTPATPLWRADAGWRSIDFISDLHLSPALPRTTATFDDYLRSTDCDALVILGDLFEAWVGDDAAGLPYEAGRVARLADAARSRPLHFMVGNRDFLVGERMREACGWVALADPTCLEAFGRRYLLGHGDSLCLADAPYQAFRRTVRSADWQRDFLARGFDERLAIAADMRRRSESRRHEGDAVDADVDAAAAVALLRSCGAETMIHGHTHRPGTIDLGGGLARHVLSDWDLDDPRHLRADVLRLTAGGLQRLDPRTAAPARR